MWTLDDTAVNILKGIDIWLVDCAGYKNKANKVHANLDRIYELNEQIKASTVYLTSLTVSMDYETLVQELPKGYKAAHDGMRFKTQY